MLNIKEIGVSLDRVFKGSSLGNYTIIDRIY